jgi:hypothetical protein
MVSPPIPVAESDANQYRAALAWNGSTFVVAWLEWQGGGITRARARPLDAGGLPAGSILELDSWAPGVGYPIGPSISVASRDTTFAVALAKGFVGSVHSVNSMYFFDAKLEPIGSPITLTTELFEPAEVVVDDDANGWLVTWTRQYVLPKVGGSSELRFAKVGAPAGPVSASVLVHADPCGIGVPGVAGFGSSHLSVWSNQCAVPYPRVTLHRIGAQVESAELAAYQQSIPGAAAVASAGDTGVVAWPVRSYSATEQSGIEVIDVVSSSADGSPILGSRKTAWLGEAAGVQLAHDGTGHLLVWTTDPDGSQDVLALWLDDSANTASARFSIFQDRESIHVSDLVGLGAGRSLLAFSDFDASATPPRTRVHVAVIDRVNVPCPEDAGTFDGASGSGGSEGSEGDAAPPDARGGAGSANRASDARAEAPGVSARHPKTEPLVVGGGCACRSSAWRSDARTDGSVWSTWAIGLLLWASHRRKRHLKHSSA